MHICVFQKLNISPLKRNNFYFNCSKCLLLLLVCLHLYIFTRNNNFVRPVSKVGLKNTTIPSPYYNTCVPLGFENKMFSNKLEAENLHQEVIDILRICSFIKFLMLVLHLFQI